MEYTVNFLLANLHEGQWFGFRKTDDEGNKISDDQRMKLSNVDADLNFVLIFKLRTYMHWQNQLLNPYEGTFFC